MYPISHTEKCGYVTLFENQGHTKKFSEILELYPFSFPNRKVTNIRAYPIFHPNADTQIEAGECRKTDGPREQPPISWSG